MNNQTSCTPASGSCLCQAVKYKYNENMGIFQYCHCSRCRKFTGSGFASNIFVKPDHFSWLEGEHLLNRYEMEDSKYFATSFCTQCGSSMPWLAKGGRVVVVPAGTLDTDPEIRPKQNIHCLSKAIWYEEPESLPQFGELPD